MYVLLEYLTYLAVVSFLGLVLFGTAVLGLVVKTGASKLADQAAGKIPQIVSRIPSRDATDIRDGQHDRLAPS
jgi:hypothetical protein